MNTGNTDIGEKNKREQAGYLKLMPVYGKYKLSDFDKKEEYRIRNELFEEMLERRAKIN